MIICMGIFKKSQLAKNTALFTQVALSGFDTPGVDSCMIAYVPLPLKTTRRPDLAITVAALPL